MTSNNHFSDIANQVQRVPQNQRPETLINGIAKQMQSSSDPNVQQLGAELQGIKGTLVESMQQH